MTEFVQRLEAQPREGKRREGERCLNEPFAGGKDDRRLTAAHRRFACSFRRPNPEGSRAAPHTCRDGDQWPFSPSFFARSSIFDANAATLTEE